MRVRVETRSKRVTEGGRFTLTRDGCAKDRALLIKTDTSFNIEDPGWPDGTPVLVMESGDNYAVLEPDTESEVWRQAEATGGIKGALARWALKHAGGDMQKGRTDMVGEIYEGLVVKTDTVAAGPNSDKNVTKIVYAAEPFVAKDEKTASGIIMAAAIKEKGVDANEVEVLVRRWRQ